MIALIRLLEPLHQLARQPRRRCVINRHNQVPVLLERLNQRLHPYHTKLPVPAQIG